MLWGHPVAFWDTSGFVLMLVGAGLGLAALLVALISSVILYKVTGQQQAQLKIESDAASERIEKLRSQNVVLEKLVSPRYLEQQHAATKLKPAAASVTYWLTSVSDFEARFVSQQIEYLLQEAGWKKFSGEPPAISFRSFEESGIWVETGEERALPTSQTALSLVDRIKDSDVDARWHMRPGLPAGLIVVMVGLRPVPMEIILNLLKKFPNSGEVGNRIVP